MHNNKGYTLIEMLMVMFVVSTILYSFSNVYSGYIHSNAVSQSTMQFKSVMEQAKACAIINNTKSSIQMRNDSYTYSCLYKREFKTNPGVTIENNYPSSKISFTQNGTVNRAGTISFHYGNAQKSIVISIGNGGYYVK